jgi:hypothetical protein
MKQTLKIVLITLIVGSVIVFLGNKITITKSPGFVQKEGPCGFKNDGCVTVIQFN